MRPEPKNKLSKEEYQSVLNIVNRSEFADLMPSQIVPALVDRGIYIASESTFYRILRNEKMQHHRGNTKAPKKIKGKPLVLHSDNGAPMKSYTLKTKLEALGVLSSYSRPRVSNDNPFSEAQFKTLKYRPNYPQDEFKTIEQAREWVLEFVDWYNNIHYHSSLKFLTPNSRHNGKTDEIMSNRKKVYEAAKKLNPQRFNRGIRNWDLNDKVALNPTNEIKDKINKGII
ncbi:integrase core domain-containing protein [Haloimpatiens sp. FM7315]|uniref:integrase core domain-containing protein n=1 Tax=Haloimpatiens sp. FM7315 TaxID=3298609 RepID=UPI0035A38475